MDPRGRDQTQPSAQSWYVDTMRRRTLVLLLAVVLGSMHTSAAHAQTAVSVPVGGAWYGPSWRAGDEAWFLRNRRIAMAGKVLTVVGLSRARSRAPTFAEHARP